MNGELTLLVIRLVFLAVMWVFVFSVIYALRSDLFGTRSREYQKAIEQSRQQTFSAAPQTSPVPETVPATPRSEPQSTGARQVSPPRIVVTSGPKRGTELELRGEPISIGRARDSDLLIQDDYTSTHHARLLNWNGQWMIQDLDSTNGTYVDGERVSQPTAVNSGTQVRIGTTTFELR